MPQPFIVPGRHVRVVDPEVEVMDGVGRIGAVAQREHEPDVVDLGGTELDELLVEDEVVAVDDGALPDDVELVVELLPERQRCVSTYALGAEGLV